MKKFIFPIFMALFSGVAFGAAEPNCVQPGNLMDIPSNQTTGNGNRYIKSDDYLEETPRYLKCGQDNINDMKYCPHDAIVVDSERKVYKCTSRNVWSIVDNIQTCTEASKTLIESGLKNNYRQAKKEDNNFVLFYNQTQGKYLLKYCLSPIEPFKRMEDECNKNGDLDSGICHKLTTISNNTATSPTKASDSIELQNSEQTIPTDSLQETGDYETHEEFDSAAWRRDTENAYKHERDNAQSWANKGITAGSTLLTGEGAMKAAQALAEQKADKKAEEQMAEWISKMGCEYGNGQQVNLGKEETLPAGDLAKYYAEYKQLADKLKTTKAALNLRSGIEAEVLYDRAETGLYQYKIAEIQSGSTPSLSRALMDGESADATAWNAQKTATQNKLITGGVLAATGVVAGYAANQYINRNHENKYKDLIMTFTEIKKELQIKYPEAFVPEEIPVTPVTEEPIIATIEETPPVIEQPQQATQLDLEPFSDKYLFASGLYKLKNNVSALDDYIQRVIDTLNRPEYADFKICIQIDGHTDRVPPKPGFMSNQVLSQKRADSVKDYLDTELGSIKTHISNITSTGHGEEQCTKDKYKKIDDSNCRRIDITINACNN